MPVSLEQLRASLAAQGVRVSAPWLEACLSHLKHSGPVPTQLAPLTDKAFGVFLHCDIYESADTTIDAVNNTAIPTDLHATRRGRFSPDGPAVLQVSAGEALLCVRV